MLYKNLVEVYEELEKTTKRLEKTHMISLFLKKAPKQDLEHVIYLLQGRVFPVYASKELGVSSMIIIKVLISATGTGKEKIENLWKKHGDLGLVAEDLILRKKQTTLFSSKLTIEKVFDNLRKLSSLEGSGTVNRKVSYVSELLISSSPSEAKFIVKTILSELRIGVAQGVLRDAILWAFFSKDVKLDYLQKENKIEIDRDKYNKYIDIIQEAFDLTNDFAEVALIAKNSGIKGLRSVKLKIFKPINVMLYQKAVDIKDAFKQVGIPAFFEYKYDGFRLQIHKKNDKIVLYTRRLENVTKQFPEVVDYVKKYVNAKICILDSEAIGFNPKTIKFLPFQSISQRIKRKYDIHSMARKFPVEVNIFDILMYNDKNLTKEPFKDRRKLLEKIVTSKSRKIVLAKQILTEKEKEAEKFYREAVSHGQEGVMVKNINGIYKPGSRVGYGVKVKPERETFDLVIVKAEYGEGKRSSWLSSYTVACLHNDMLLEIGKVSTGIKEKGEEVTYEKMTEELKPLILKSKGREVILGPKVVVEVAYEEIQKSPSYSSGFALRFPRFVRIRYDKSKKEASTLEEVKECYSIQRK